MDPTFLLGIDEIEGNTTAIVHLLAISFVTFFFLFFFAHPYRYANYTHNHKNAIDTIDALHALIREILPPMACANLH